jgi:hypothetical protein
VALLLIVASGCSHSCSAPPERELNENRTAPN